MTARPRVALFHYQTYPEIRIAKFAEALAADGMDVVVVARDVVAGDDPRGKHPYADRAHTSPHITLRAVTGDRPTRLRRALSTPYPVSPPWRSAIRQVLDEGADLLICRDFHLSPAVVDLGHGSGVPVLVDIAENYPALLRLWRSQEGRRRAVVNGFVRNIRAAEAVERRGVSRADAVTVVVPEHEQRMRQLGARDVRTVENTPALDHLLDGYDGASHAQEDPARPLEVVYTGEIHRYRGIDTVIDAAALLKAAGASMRFTLVGTGKLLAEMQALAARRGVGDTVQFLGWQPDLRPFLARADIGLVPPHASAHQETTMPNKLYDLMAFGKPVVVCDAAPLRRVVHESDCGLVFRAGDAASLSDRLIGLTDNARRRQLGENGARAVRDRYNWDTDAAVLTRLVRDLLGSHAAAATPAHAEGGVSR